MKPRILTERVIESRGIYSKKFIYTAMLSHQPMQMDPQGPSHPLCTQIGEVGGKTSFPPIQLRRESGDLGCDLSTDNYRDALDCLRIFLVDGQAGHIAEEIDCLLPVGRAAHEGKAPLPRFVAFSHRTQHIGSVDRMIGSR